MPPSHHSHWLSCNMPLRALINHVVIIIWKQENTSRNMTIYCEKIDCRKNTTKMTNVIEISMSKSWTHKTHWTHKLTKLNAINPSYVFIYVFILNTCCLYNTFTNI